MSKDKDIFEVVNKLIDPLVSFLSDTESQICLAAALYEKSIETGKTKKIESIPNGFIDEDTISDYCQLSDDVLQRLRLLKIAMSNGVYCINKKIVFSKKEIEHLTKDVL
jgi:hypothetical protein